MCVCVYVCMCVCVYVCMCVCVYVCMADSAIVEHYTNLIQFGDQTIQQWKWVKDFVS